MTIFLIARNLRTSCISAGYPEEWQFKGFTINMLALIDIISANNRWR